MDQRANSLVNTDKDILQKLKMQQFRANSINFGSAPDKTLKFLNNALVKFPKRERFNEDTSQIIEEIKNRNKGQPAKLNTRTISAVSRKDEASTRSKSIHNN